LLLSLGKHAVQKWLTVRLAIFVPSADWSPLHITVSITHDISNIRYVFSIASLCRYLVDEIGIATSN
jgi:hypothetical protein